MYTWLTTEETIEQSFDTIGNAWYCIFIALWTTFFVESWKRKQNTIGDMWMMRDFQDATTERKQFKASLSVDPETRGVWKIIFSAAWTKMILVGLPVTFFFVALVIAT